MKGKKLFYIALFWSLIVLLYGCSGRNSRAYLEDRIGNQISRVYPTQNLEDLFEQFPNGFLIEQSYLFEDRIIDFELEGILSKFKLKKTHYNDNNGSFDLEYVVKNEQINQFLDLDNQQQVTLGFHGSNANRSYYYTLSVEVGSNLIFLERISD